MTAYKYKALDGNGLYTVGYIFSNDIQNEIQGLIHRLEKQKLFLVSYRKVWPLEQWILLKRAQKERANFFLHIKYMTHAGLSIMQALQSFSSTPNFTGILQQIMAHIHHGKLLSEVLAWYPSLFDAFMVATIRMGEKTNHLSQAFDICFSYVTYREKTTKQIHEAIRYPLFLLLLLSAVFTFLFSAVVPMLLDFLQSTDRPLPFSTKLLLKVTSLLQSFGWILLGLGAGLVLLYYWLPVFQLYIHRCKYRLPYLGKLLLMVDLSAFFQQLFMLQKGGIPVLDSLLIAQKTNSNKYWHDLLETIKHSIKNGHTVAASFAQHSQIPLFVIQLVETGEKSGAFLPTLHHLGEILDHKTTYKIQQLINLLNPIFMLILGGLLLWIVMAVFMPLYTVVL